jgi:chromosome segregation ATPase
MKNNDSHEFIEVQGNPNLVRDSQNTGIINVNESEYRTYIENYKRKYNEINRIKKLESDVTEMKDNLNEIKDLLKSLLSK